MPGDGPGPLGPGQILIHPTAGKACYLHSEHGVVVGQQHPDRPTRPQVLTHRLALPFVDAAS
jgi:hypothetical protein